MVTLPDPILTGYGLLDPRGKWAVMAVQMTEAYFEIPGIREEFEEWLVEYEAKKQNAPTVADCESALPGTEIADSAPVKVIGGTNSIAQNGRNCNA